MPDRPPRSRLRRWLRLVCLLGALIAVVVLLSPWWWIHAARGTLTRNGVSFQSFQRIGYTRFALNDVRVRSEGVEADVRRLEADTPLVWLWRGAFDEPGAIAVDSWQVRLREAVSAKNETSSSIDGWPALRRLLREVLPTLQQWVPAAEAGAGELAWNDQSLKVDRARWSARDGRLQLEGLHWRDQDFRVEGQWHADTEALALVATHVEDTWKLQVASEQNTLAGSLHLWGGALPLRAVFPEQGWIPREAEISAESLAVPGSLLRVETQYPALATTGRLHWQNNRFTWQLQVSGQTDEARGVPPLSADLAGAGDPAELRIQKLDISLPGAVARLLAPVVIDRSGHILSGASQFSLDADLAQLPLRDGLAGKITGRMNVDPSSDREPRLTASLEASKVRAADVDLPRASFEAELAWPQLTIKESRLEFGDGSLADVRGRWDIAERRLHNGRVAAELHPAALARWLPEGTTFEKFSLSAEAEGAWPVIEHKGQLEVEKLSTELPHPVSLSARWTASGADNGNFELESRTGDSSLKASGKLSPKEAVIEEATLALAGERSLTLTTPATLRWGSGFSVQNVDFSSDGSRLALTASSTSAQIIASGITSTTLRDFVATETPPWQIDSAEARGDWSSGVLVGALTLHAQVQADADQRAIIDALANTSATGVDIERLQISDAHGPVVDARGRLPLQLTPTSDTRWKFIEDGRWAFTATTIPESPFWNTAAATGGFELQSPRLDLRVEGPASNPDASLDLHVAGLKASRFRLPPISDLIARIHISDTGSIQLEQLAFLAAGQAFTASGQTRVSPEQWKSVIENPAHLWSGDAEVSFQIPNIDLSAFATFLPAALAPTGRVSGDLAVRADGEMRGALKITNAATHPITPFGSFREINAEVDFSGRKASLKSLSALASGQPVQASGTVEYPSDAPLKVDVALTGKNLPLARQTGLLMRGDLDLRVSSGADGITTLGGKVVMHDSLFLRDVRSLIPTRGGGPASRPPYFSVTAEPFRDWKLALSVSGSRFLIIRTPLFSGVVSGKIDLSGTLFEPIAIGQVTFDQGMVSFPFVSMRLKSGAVRLTQADPYSPQLSLIAESRTLGYDVRMEVSGTASDPTLVFSSTPSLSSEQVLLMVMAGEMPHSDINYSGTQRAQQLGLYLGKSLLSNFSGDPTAAERLIITSGENVTESGKETFSAEYLLNDRWSLIGEIDEFDDYNMGVKRRLIFKKKPNAEMP